MSTCPALGYPADRFSLEPHAALPPVAHAARRNPSPFLPWPHYGDFPPKERGPVSWLPGGSRLYPLLQLAADWEVLTQQRLQAQYTDFYFVRRTGWYWIVAMKSGEPALSVVSQTSHGQVLIVSDIRTHRRLCVNLALLTVLKEVH